MIHPCPKCGRKDTVRGARIGHWTTRQWAIRCATCPGTLARGNSILEAIEAWNLASPGSQAEPDEPLGLLREASVPIGILDSPRQLLMPWLGEPN